jgi:TonB family protein
MTAFAWRREWLFAALLWAAILPAAARTPGPAPALSREAPRAAAVRSGALRTQNGLLLAFTADSGNVRIFTDAAGEVRYLARVEAEASDPSAGKRLEQFSLTARNTPRGVVIAGRMPSPRDLEHVWVSYEVHIPLRYALEVSTRAGNIVVQDIDGSVVLSTGGGNIQVGRVGDARRLNVAAGGRGTLSARLDTAGGHILVGDVAGSLHASTAGGHITAGNVYGDAVLHTGGGHVHVGRVAGAAQLSSGGGDIVAERADTGVVATTAGGRIELGDAAGAVRARTGGGGIEITRVAGPTQLDSGDGGILLAGVEAPLRASTTTGAITASFSPLFGAAAGGRPASSHENLSELASGQGDIVVYVPREMAITIDALVERGSDHHIVADPSLPLRISYQDSADGRALRAESVLNGGGEVLHLKTIAGNIQLRFLDPDVARRLAARQADLVERRVASRRALAGEMERQIAASMNAGTTAGETGGGRPEIENAPQVAAQNSGAARAEDPSRLSEFARMFQGFWWSGLRVPPEEQQKRLRRSVAPEYPDIALQAGLEGDVALRVAINKDGAVETVTPLSGEPVLVRAALEAVEQWSYAPALLDGRPVAVVTTVTLAFRLR